MRSSPQEKDKESHSVVTQGLAVYPGSFDPVTYGHMDVMERAAKLFPEVVVALGVHPTRVPVFSVDERVDLLRQVSAGYRNVRVTSFDGLLIEFCHSIGARVVVRGLRAATDFEYELQIAHANADLYPDIDTIFLPTRTNYGFLSASLVREIALHGGDVSRFAPKVVCEALQAKFPSAKRR